MTIDQIIAVLESLDAEIRAKIATEQDPDMLMMLRGESMGLRDAIHEIKMAQIRTGT